jgi:alpha-amylase
MNTFNKLWGVNTPQEAKKKVEEQCAEFAHIENPANLEEQALKLCGTDIYYTFIKGYTEKQWGRLATELPAFIIKRIPFRFTYDNNYFNDPFQGIPHGGYNSLIAALIDGSDIRLNTDFFSDRTALSAPAVIELLHELNATGCCEFLCEPYSHGLSSLKNETCFCEEVERMRVKIKDYFGQDPKVFRNSSLIYDNEIGGIVAGMGFKGMLAEGAKHVLGWKSPHYLYHCAENPNLKLLLRDFKLSDDISLRFSNTEWSEYPLFADKYIGWIASLPENEQVINIFMELSALGIFQPLSSNILEFLKALPECAKQKGITFSTPSEIVTKLKSVDMIDVPYPMSWTDEERDISPWLGNVMQREAFDKLYSVAERVHLCSDRRIKQDWDYLQASNNFRFMTTKQMGVSLDRGIYDSPYDAFTNYMNILGDFIARVNSLYPVDMEDEELNSLLTTIRNQEEELVQLNDQVKHLQALVKEQSEKEKAPAKKAPAKKTTAAKKTTTAKK